MEKQVDVQTEYEVFLSILKQATTLGLELENSKKSEIRKTAGGELGIWAATYNVIDHNGFGQSHGLFHTYTKRQALELKKLIDDSIFDNNEKRETVIKKEFEVYDIDNLKRYLQIRKSEINSSDDNRILSS